MKYIIADPDAQNSMELKKILDRHERVREGKGMKNKRMRNKRIFSLALIFTMIFSILPQLSVPVFATSNANTIDVNDNTNGTLPAGVTYNANLFTIGTDASNKTITVTGTTSTNTIAVAADVSNLTLVLSGASITNHSNDKSPIDLQGNSSVTIQLANGTMNTLDANSGYIVAGLHVTTSAAVTITGIGTGTLTAIGGTNGAGIGGCISTGGAITIDSGIVNATGGQFAAGIGGGANSGGGTITINGGTVTGKGGYGAAGIGGGVNGDGGTITINGGAVTASNVGGNGSGIGGGSCGAGGTIAISGGTVIATGGTHDASGIGPGFNGTSGVVDIGATAVVMAASKYDSPFARAIHASSGSGSIINASLTSAVSAADTYLQCNGNVLKLPANYRNFAFSSAAASAVSVYSNQECTPGAFLGSIATNPGGIANIPVTDLGTNPTNFTDVKFVANSVIDVGNTSNMPSNVTYNSGVFTINNNTVTPITVTGTTTTNAIAVASGVSGLSLILNNASIASPSGGNSPIDLQSNASVTIQLASGTTNTLNASSANYKAGLCVSSTAAIVINGTTGILNATGGLRSAGMGGSDTGAVGTITINGGTVNATGGDAGAGIGGGYTKGAGNITISGGTVNATGGAVSIGGGAGIGSGYSGTGGTITIDGGTVNATGGDTGAGIGGGGNGGGGVNITISGGKVNAAGGNITYRGGAGIGGGSGGAGGNITITGSAVVMAIGSYSNCAGIGSGDNYGVSGTVNIGGTPVVMAAAVGGSGKKRAIDASSGSSSGSVMDAQLDNFISSSVKYLKCNGNALSLSGYYTSFAFNAAVDSPVNAYSDSDCTQFFGSIVSNSGATSIPVTSLGTYSAFGTSVKLYQAQVRVKKDDLYWSSGTPDIRLSTSDTALTGAVTGTWFNGAYTFTGINSAATYYVWDVTGNKYTGISITNSNPSQTLNYYTVALSTGAGIASTSGSGVYLSGSNVPIDATVSPGYTWSKWTQTTGGVDVSTTQNYQITNITAPLSYTANATQSNTGGDGGGGGGSSGGNSVTTPTSAPTHVPVIVDNNNYYIGNIVAEDNTATITVDQSEFDKQLANARQSVVIPVTTDSSTIVAQLVVKNVKDMNDKGVPLTVQTGNVNYSIPASSIDTNAIISSLGVNDPSLAPVHVTIKTNVDETTKAIVDSAVSTARVTQIIPAVQFDITASYNGKTYDVENFDRFVNRSVEITSEQARQITTAIVVNPDGTTRHVPTSVYQKDGKWYAQINSRTNSTYVLIFNQMSFSDAKGKWYQSIANEMGSRRIISGVGNNCFGGERAITRAEFAVMVVRALGLPANGTSTFSDVPSGSWCSGAVATAAKYGIVSGYGNNKFKPDANITREEAMQMIYNASRLTPYAAVNGVDNTGSFIDYGTQSAWATNAVNFNINNGFIQGFNGRFYPKSNITRAETATVILKLIQKSGLVDVRTKM